MKSAGDSTAANRGTGTPSAVSRRRITSLSCACSSASGPGRTVTPASTSARRCSCGTPSWSKVTAAVPTAKARIAARSRAVRDVAADQGGGLAGCGREHPQRLPERDRGLVRHAGQLACADHAHDRQGWRNVHGVGSLREGAPSGRDVGPWAQWTG